MFTKTKARKRSIKVEAYGLKFDSELEYRFYNLLKKVNISFEYQYPVHLIEKTQYKTKKVLLLNNSAAEAVKLTIDFVFKIKGITYYIDTKGHEKSVTEASKLRYNILKHKIIEQGEQNESQIKFLYETDVKRLEKISIVGLAGQTNFINEFLKIKAF